MPTSKCLIATQNSNPLGRHNVHFFTNRFGFKQTHTFLAGSREQRLVNTLKFVGYNSQLTTDSSKRKESGLPLLIFQANRLALCSGFPPAKETLEVK